MGFEFKISNLNDAQVIVQAMNSMEPEKREQLSQDERKIVSKAMEMLKLGLNARSATVKTKTKISGFDVNKWIEAHSKSKITVTELMETSKSIHIQSWADRAQSNPAPKVEVGENRLLLKKIPQRPKTSVTPPISSAASATAHPTTTAAEKAKAEAEAKVAAKAEAKAKAIPDAKARAEAEAKAKARAEVKKVRDVEIVKADQSFPKVFKGLIGHAMSTIEREQFTGGHVALIGGERALEQSEGIMTSEQNILKSYQNKEYGSDISKMIEDGEAVLKLIDKKMKGHKPELQNECKALRANIEDLKIKRDRLPKLQRDPD